MKNDPTLTEALAARGLTHRKAGAQYKHDIVKAGKVVFNGAAHEVWDWLEATKQKVKRCTDCKEVRPIVYECLCYQCWNAGQ